MHVRLNGRFSVSYFSSKAFSRMIDIQRVGVEE